VDEVWLDAEATISEGLLCAGRALVTIIARLLYCCAVKARCLPSALDENPFLRLCLQEPTSGWLVQATLL